MVMLLLVFFPTMLVLLTVNQTLSVLRKCCRFSAILCLLDSLSSLVASHVPRLRSNASDGSPDLRCAQGTPGRSAPFLRRMLPGRPKSRPPSNTGRGSHGPPPSDFVHVLHLATRMQRFGVCVNEERGPMPTENTLD